MGLNNTPTGDRLHIGIFGRRNAGKSALINALTGQDAAIVSPAPGTTTDPIRKAMELHPIGPVVFIDTAGFDDEGELGELRTDRSRKSIDASDIAVVVIDGKALISEAESEKKHGRGSAQSDSEEGYLDVYADWIRSLNDRDCPFMIAINKCDGIDAADRAAAIATVKKVLSENELTDGGELPLLAISATSGDGIDELRNELVRVAERISDKEEILAPQIGEDSLVLLVMPQDIQAPKGRLILPQVQTIRALLDRNCTVVSSTAEGASRALERLNRAPDWIITDSQCFSGVAEIKPDGSKLTSFSIIMAQAKGDIQTFTDGAKAIDDLIETAGSGQTPKILIAEACTHVPQNEDIGTVKIPRILRKILGEEIEIVNVRGADFPADEELRSFDLVIHCGACMFNRRHVMNRIAAARRAGVPITNYGVFLAKVNGILKEVSL